MNPLVEEAGDKEVGGKIRELWMKRDKALKEGSFQQQALEGKIKDLEYLKSQRPKLAREMTKVFKGEDMLKMMMEERSKAAETMSKI